MKPWGKPFGPMGVAASGGGAPPLPPTEKDTSTLQLIGTTTHREVIDADSMRAVNVGGTNGYFRENSYAGKTWRIRGTLSAYDGAISGASATVLNISNNFADIQKITEPGAFDVTIAITGSRIVFSTDVDSGFRIDDFHVVEVV